MKVRATLKLVDALVAAALITSCTSIFTPFECTTDSEGFAFCPGEPPPEPLPPATPVVGDSCPTTDVITIDTVSHDDFVAAIASAVTLATEVTIRFDEGVFSQADPQMIALDPARLPFPAESAKLCIDGRGAGVILSWISRRDDGRDVWKMAAGSSLYGLTLLGLPSPLVFDGGQVAGNRFGSTGTTWVPATASHLLEVVGLTDIGPGNVFVGADFGILVNAPALIIDNWFGVDRVSGQTFPLGTAIDVRSTGSSTLTVKTNNMRVTLDGISSAIGPRTGVPDIFASQNHIISENGRYGVNLVGTSGDLWQGQIIGFDVGARLEATTTTLSKVWYTATGVDISNDGGPVPPSITSWDADSIDGTCAMDGTVQLYDTSTPTHSYSGTAICTGGAWSLPWGPLSLLNSGSVLRATWSASGVGTSAFSPAFSR